MIYGFNMIQQYPTWSKQQIHVENQPVHRNILEPGYNMI